MNGVRTATQQVMPAEAIRDVAAKLFDVLGSPHGESVLVAESLVEASLRGYDSHGVIRIPQYIRYLQDAVLSPGAPFEVLKDSPVHAVVDGHKGWGQVVGRRAMQLAIEKARANTLGAVVVRNCPHVGRLGEYPALAVGEGMIGLAVVNLVGGKEVEEVAPWGGIDPKLAPNPIAWAAPSGREWPMVLDMTTSVIPEGKVRLARYKGDSLPEGCLIDSDGNPTTDPNKFYGPPQGALLPLGGLAGHKGYGLAILTEVLGGALSSAGCVGEKQAVVGNGLFFQAIRIEDFVPMDEFLARMRRLHDWIKSSRRRPGVSEIFLPGEAGYRTYQRRLKDGIPVDQSVWDEIRALAASLQVEV